MDEQTLQKSIATTVADYRLGEIAPIDATHVGAWVGQFDGAVRATMLAELDHILRKSYVSRTDFENFVSSLIMTQELVGGDACGFWKRANFLSIQGGGSSQADILDLFDHALKQACGFSVGQCGSPTGPFVYLDDAVYGGNRVRIDLTNWLPNAPAAMQLHVIVMGLHSQGASYANETIRKAFASAGKKIEIKWWKMIPLETIDARTSDVLWPGSLPTDPRLTAYLKGFTHKVILRPGAELGTRQFFSSADNRRLIENEFLCGGLRVLDMCPDLAQKKYMRPLGNSVLETLGCGALFVTFRNCANNCPLVLWAGSPWIPLFARKTN